MLDIKVSAALMGFTHEEQRKILNCVKEGVAAPTARLQKAVDEVTEIHNTHVEVVEGYAGFPIEKDLITKNKQKYSDDRNIGRVISQGGNSMVITGKKSDGRYMVVGKKGEKTAKAPEDIGLNFQREHIDIEDLHIAMTEGLKQARKNVGASTCWKGYKAKGTKTKDGKEVPNCVKEDVVDEGYKEIDRKKENAMYRRAGNLARTSLSSKGKAKEDAQNKSAKIVSAITRQKEKERFDRIGKDPKHQNNYKEEFTLEGFIDFDDPELDLLTFEELEEICTEALLELDGEVLTEALEMIDGMTLLSEDYYADAVAKSKAAAKTPAARAGRRNLRKEKVKAALKSAASSVKKGAAKVGEKVGSAAGKAVNVADKAKSAAGAAAQKVGSAASKAGSAAKKVGSAAGEVAGAAAGGFRKGYADARGKSSSTTKSSSGTVNSGDVGKSSSSSSSSDGGNRVRLRDKIKSGIKKAVGSVARSVSRGARNVARRLGEEKYSWRKEMGIEE